jgi:hypothetical protein
MTDATTATEAPPAAPLGWAERHTCHEGERMIHARGEWRPPRGGEEWWRTCDYCGSMHPEDLLAALERGARLELSDMKYGWPHKFYLHGGGIPHAKFYNVHLFDGHGPEARAALVDALWKHGGIRFEVLPDFRLRVDTTARHPSWQTPAAASTGTVTLDLDALPVGVAVDLTAPDGEKGEA